MSQLFALARAAAPLRAAPPPLQRRRGAAHAQRARAAATPAAGAEEEVFIRRRPPQGTQKLDVGSSFDFKMEALDRDGKRIDNPDHKPRNILEEIVWYKDVEIERVRARAQLPGPRRAARRARGVARSAANPGPALRLALRAGAGAAPPRRASRAPRAPRRPRASRAVEERHAAGCREEGCGCGAARARLCWRAAPHGGLLGHARPHRGG